VTLVPYTSFCLSGYSSAVGNFDNDLDEGNVLKLLVSIDVLLNHCIEDFGCYIQFHWICGFNIIFCGLRNLIIWDLRLM